MSSFLIIGGGLIGLTLARELKKRGVSDVTILEKGEVGREASYAAAGMLSPQAEADCDDDFYKFCVESKRIFPDLEAELLDETGVDIELDKTGTLYLAFDENDREEISERFKWQKEAGLEVERLSAQETHKLEPFVSPDSVESLFFPGDWQVENRKLLKALRAFVETSDIELLKETEVCSLTSANGKILSVEDTNGSEYFADQVIICGGAWTSLLKTDENVLSIPSVKPIRGQMVSYHTAKRLLQHVIYSPRGYIVPRANGKILAGSTTEDVGFENETTVEGIEIVKQNALEIAPSIANLRVDDSWAGLRPYTPDELPLIGKLDSYENLFIATAHYRNGILLAPMTAKILVDRILNQVDSTFLEICNPNRLKSVNASL